jgi:hypothetical protein
MGRARNLAAVLVTVGTLGIAAEAAPAGAATSPLLTTADLPATYTTVSEPTFTSFTSPRYPTLDATSCVMSNSSPFSGTVPDTSTINFATDKTNATGGAETVFTYSDESDAESLYDLYAKAYRAAPKCGTAIRTVPASGATPASTVEVGTWKNLAVAPVGDEHVGIVLNLTDPSTGSASRLVVFRDGVNVVVLTLRDDTQAKGAFDKLVATAAKRARAAT